MGCFTEGDFAAFEEQHPKNLYERIRVMLNTWSSKNNSEVNRDDLVEKLKTAKLNMIAQQVKTMNLETNDIHNNKYS